MLITLSSTITRRDGALVTKFSTENYGVATGNFTPFQYRCRQFRALCYQ